MRFLYFEYYDDRNLFMLENESDELAKLITQFQKLNKYELVQDLIVSKFNQSRYCDKVEDWIKELEEEYFPYRDEDDNEKYEVFLKIKELISNEKKDNNQY